MRLLLPVLFTCASTLLLPTVKRLDDSATETTEIAARNGTEDSSGNTEIAGAGPETSAGNDSTSPVYIVVLKEEKEEAEYEEHEQWVLNQFSELRKRKREEDSSVAPQEVEFFNVSSFHGYAGDIPESLLNTIRENPLVDFVEQNSRGKLSEYTTQNDAPWGLARISRRQRDPASRDYRYDTEGGRGVAVFVLDTGIQVTHREFEDRATWGESFDDPSAITDTIGHGTSIAGIIGSKTYGVAKEVDLVAVKIGGAHGAYISDIIMGVQYAVSEHMNLIDANIAGFKGSIINLSIESKPSRSLDRAVRGAVRAGVQVVVGAGNENIDACTVSPARSRHAITVGATSRSDQRASFSNYGPCVDIHAPGRLIQSVGLISSPEVHTGTSVAAPHVTGLLAYLLSLQPEQGSDFYGQILLSPVFMRQVLLDLAVPDVVTGLPPNTPNLFAYNGAESPLAQVLDLVGPESADSGDEPN